MNLWRHKLQPKVNPMEVAINNIELPVSVGMRLRIPEKILCPWLSSDDTIEVEVRSISISCNANGVWIKKFRICEVVNGKTTYKQADISFDELNNIAVENTDVKPTPDKIPHWIRYDADMMECSVCKSHVSFHDYLYCPYCGKRLCGWSHE